jgi:hypothetical protein
MPFTEALFPATGNWKIYFPINNVERQLLHEFETNFTNYTNFF